MMGAAPSQSDQGAGQAQMVGAGRTIAPTAPQRRALRFTRGGWQQASMSHMPFLYGINVSV